MVGHLGRDIAFILQEWEGDLEGSSLSGARTRGRYAALVHLNEALDHGEPDSQAALSAIEGAIALHEQVKHAGEQVGGDARAVVDDGEDRLTVALG